MEIKGITRRETHTLIIAISGVDDMNARYGTRRAFQPKVVRVSWGRRSVFSPSGQDVGEWILEESIVSGPNRLKGGGLGGQEVELRFYMYELAERPEWLVTLVEGRHPDREHSS